MWYEGYFNIYLMGGVFGKLNREKLAKYKNISTFQTVFSRMLLDALHRYKINGIPDTMSERVIMQSLLWYGGVVVFEKGGNLLALPGVPTGDGFNINGDPSACWVFSRNGQMNEQVKVHIPGGDDSTFLRILTDSRTTGKGGTGVYIWENDLRFPFLNTVVEYANAVSDAMRTLDVVRQNLKHPYIVVAEESVVPSVREFFKKRDENLDFIIDSGVFPVDSIKVLPLGDDNGTQAKDVTALIEWYEAKFRELCGIRSNSQMDKKGENLVTAELTVNNEYEDLQPVKCIESINRGLDIVNKFFGTNMSCTERKEISKNEDNDFSGDERDGGGSLPGEDPGRS